MEEFKKRIYKYCNENAGKKVLFTLFKHLYPHENLNSINSKDLSVLTSNYVNELIGKRILKEIKKPEELLVIPYPMYEILIKKY